MRNWLHLCNFKVTECTKGCYFDGHEREDVIKVGYKIFRGLQTFPLKGECSTKLFSSKINVSHLWQNFPPLKCFGLKQEQFQALAAFCPALKLPEI